MGTYKDSGIEWIGEIPEGWEITRMQDVASYKKGPFGSSLTLDMFVEKGESTYKVYEQKNAIQGDSLLGEYYIDEKTYNQLRGFSVQSNDIIVSCAGTIGKCTILPENCEPGIINQALMRVRINKNINIFYYLYLFNIELDYADRKFSNGSAIKNIPPFNVLKKLKLPLPPLQEQAAIADFLDKKNAEIDAIVAKITQQIQTLKDYRHSLITQTVTKGLDKTVAYKDSGIDILGYVNRDYEIIRLKYLCNFTTGSQDTQDADEDGQYNFYVRSPKILRTNKSDFNGTAILMAGDGVGAGKIFHYADGEFGVHQRVYILHNFKKVHPKFLHSYMSSLFSIEIEKGSAKSTVDSIRLPMLQNFNVVVPPLQEQTAIADYLDDKTAKIDCIIAKKEQQLELIKEHRKSLIYEYVTGKKRVKEYQQDGN